MKKWMLCALLIAIESTPYLTAIAGGIEAPPPPKWNAYVGGSAVVYIYNNCINSLATGINPIFPSAPPSVYFPGLASLLFPSPRVDAAVIGGVDIGAGFWAERSYWGIEGRYDIGSLGSQNVSFVTNFSASHVYTIKNKNHASVVLKVGYQYWPKTMPYFIMGWARTSYSAAVRVYSGVADFGSGLPIPLGTIETSADPVYKASLNGATAGLGLSQVLINHLTAFAEFSVSAYHIPCERRYNSNLLFAYIDPQQVATLASIPNTSIINLKYYHYNLRFGLNWNYQSFI